MASSKDAASLVLLGLYGFIALRLLLTWLQRRRQRRWRGAPHCLLAPRTVAARGRSR
ncbi:MULTISPECIES: hypothetical protein [Synechococcaceae]|jgi:hypothetical protein|uniref:hypothetical protein n=1 Tax=Synechococcaceae TaxID=1890426 RepID=UPI001FF8747B|nr:MULTISPECIES: hypothetical protein [Synechococcaceae]MDA1156480.1 hypothetical protein [Cyanobacteriota bacterium]UPH90745.1 hypothetical protein LY254_03335 [Synechococcus sp. NB0720_010]